MASLRLAWTRLAVEDLDQAYDYVASHNPSAAPRIIDRIASAINALRAHPEIGRSGRLEGTRELVVPDAPFIIAYRIAKKWVEILAVIHGARRWPESS